MRSSAPATGVIDITTVTGKVLLSVHVLAAIIFIGSVAVSLFPRYARTALAVSDDPGADADGTANRSAAVARVLHRISRV